MTREEIINQGRPTEPHCFDTDREEQWYSLGLYDGATANPWHSVADGDFPEYPEGDAIGPNYLVITKRGYGIMEIFSDYFMYIENGDYKFVPVDYWMEIPQLPEKGGTE